MKDEKAYGEALVYGLGKLMFETIVMAVMLVLLAAAVLLEYGRRR